MLYVGTSYINCKKIEHKLKTNTVPVDRISSGHTIINTSLIIIMSSYSKCRHDRVRADAYAHSICHASRQLLEKNLFTQKYCHVPSMIIIIVL